MSRRGVFALVFFPLFALFLSTANRSLQHLDARTNVVTAWSIGARGTVYVDSDLPSPYEPVGWFVASDDGRVVSKYPPGAALLAAPLYTLHGATQYRPVRGSSNRTGPPIGVDLPSHVPAAIVASGSAAVSVATLAALLVGFIGSGPALMSGLTAGVATGVWSIASNELWQHGPSIMWLMIGLYLLKRRRDLAAGVVMGLAILTRPLTAVIVAAIGIRLGVSNRSIRPALAVGVGSSLGLACLLVYNFVVFGAISVSGGYEPLFVELGVSWYLKNLIGALFDPARGLLIWAPFLLVLIPGLKKAWSIAPAWMQGAAIGGVVYLLVQLAANRFSGGWGFFAYRYPLETLAAAGPLLALSYRSWVADSPFRARLFRWSAAFAATGQLIGAVLL